MSIDEQNCPLQWQNQGHDPREEEFMRIIENFDQLSEEERAEILQAANAYPGAQAIRKRSASPA